MLELLNGAGGPFPISDGAGWAGMEEGADGKSALNGFETFGSESANTDKLGRLEDFDNRLQMGGAGGFKWDALGGWQFIGSNIGAGFREKRERAIIKDNGFGKEGLRGCVEFAEESPESPSADFGARAGKSFNGAFWVFLRGFADIHFNTQPIPYGGNFTEGHPGLCHPPWARVHSHVDNFFRGLCESFDVCPVSIPCVVHGIVGECDPVPKLEFITGCGKFLGCLEESVLY